MITTKKIYRNITVSSVLLILFISGVSSGQTRVTFGMKTWYATWDLPIQKLQGTIQSDFSPALLVGPYLSIRQGAFSATISYIRTVKTFDATAQNDGFFDIGFSGNRMVTREDINAFVNYSIAPEVSLFLNLKILKYARKDAMTSINKVQVRDEVKISGTGLGAGMQITTPFSGASPFYSFISTGVVINGSSSDASSNDMYVLYFLDGGLGVRILPTWLGASVGIRVERGTDSKAIIGPTANLFYTF